MPSRNNSRGAVPLIIVILLVFVGLGAWWLSSQGKLSLPFSLPTTKTEDPTANWKTHTYENVFLFKYPREMELIEHSDSFIQITNQEPKSINLPTPSDSECIGDCVSILFGVGSLGEESFKDFVIKEYEKSKSGTIGDKPPTKISINETEGYSYVIEGFASYKAIFLPVENNSYISIITNVDPQPVVNQILSTFQFLD